MSTTATDGGNGSDSPAQVEARLQAAMAFLRREFLRRPTLPEIARAAHFSRFHFHRLFRRRFGKTPKQVLVELQVAEAQRLMLEGVPLSDVARRAGFAQQSHMTIRFKLVTGQTPKRWLEGVRGATGAKRAALGE